MKNDVLLLVLIIVSAVAVAYSIYCHIRMRQQTRKLDEMLDKAIDGSFTESCFDESQLSYIENKMWKYLSSSEISARKTAEEKAKIKTLIADISHQTKTPVSNILLYSELLSECDLSDMEKDYANRIFAQSEKLSFLITSLVKLSRLETGIIALSPKENDIAPMLRDIVVQAQAKADEKGLSLKLECGDEKAVFDEKWTNEAVWNIIDNAMKYTDNGSVKITVKEYEMFACIEISDTGRGIPEAEQAQIFSRFYRSENTSYEEGVGIGLYLARQIVSSENGYIKVMSEVGKGSTFSVFLSKL
ncbi:MAG: HAMP domain-containing histidine kinase [Oscillospiraceae bacterium]|nr:HAMP domain-containing histidine kinase [Oscillospiraceae bacterium]